MSSSMSAVPIPRRRRAAAMAIAVGLVFVVAGALPWVMDAPGSVRALAAVCLLGGVAALLAGAGLVNTVRADLAAARAPRFTGCTCGHEHDAEELTVEAGCPSGSACAHGGSCASCVLRA